MKMSYVAVCAAWATGLLLGASLALQGADRPNEPPAGKGKTSILHVDAAGAQKLIKERKAVVLDIRTPNEFAAGHIAGATNIDFQARDFEQRLGALPKDKTYLVHCAGGGRSTRSLPAFQKLGFKTVAHLDGGLRAWEKDGKPLEK